MKRILTLSLLLSGLLSMSSLWGQCSELFISEYLEGSSNNKALELYNPSGASISLTDYKMYRFNNGSPTPSDSLFPQGDIDAYGTYNIVNPSADPALLAVEDTTHTMTFFNGDDAIVLIKISTGDTLDIIGVVGVDPGSAWTVGNDDTQNNTLVRKSGVAGGTTDWAQSAMNEWDTYGSDTFGFLDSHESVCDPDFVTVYPIDLVTNDADGDG
ncbi:MAG: lamin tail domain-containing protein, partial [Bacteroidota bacterium]